MTWFSTHHEVFTGRGILGVYVDIKVGFPRKKIVILSLHRGVLEFPRLLQNVSCGIESQVKCAKLYLSHVTFVISHINIEDNFLQVVFLTLP